MQPADRVTQELLDRAVAGDHEAIRVLWEVWNPPLLRFLRSRRVLSPDDLASVIWIDVARRLKAFDGTPLGFRRWLFTVAHRSIIDTARSQARRPVMTQLRGEFATSSANAFSVVGSAEWAIGLLSRLPDDQASAIALRILADLPAFEVAAVMGTSEGNVRVLTHRGLAALRKLLDPDDVHGLGPTDGAAKENPENSANSVTLAAFRSLTPDA